MQFFYYTGLRGDNPLKPR